MQKSKKIVIGLDYGTDSCRAVVIDTVTACELGSAVCEYPRWRAGRYCDPVARQYRQHPLDYTESLETVVRTALSRCPPGTAGRVAALSIDTTASTPALIDETGVPLALRPAFADDPDAMFILWKDHTALAEAAEIDTLAHSGSPDYTLYSGGVYSSEWVWAKMLHVLRKSPSLRQAAFSWIEHGDWMPALLTGCTQPGAIRRSRCLAGHKALWHPSWGGLPPESFFSKLDPLLGTFRGRLYDCTYTGDRPVGTITPEWAARLGLPPSVLIGTGGTDCHVGAVGAGIRPGELVQVLGTSTCHLLAVPPEWLGGRAIGGISGQVDGSVVPGLVGLEAGQSAFGDIYAWFCDLLLWPLQQLEPDRSQIRRWREKLLPLLCDAAGKLPSHPGDEACPLALDWMNGRRNPDNNPLVTGALTGLSLGTDAPVIFRALVEATAFGSRAIVDCFLRQGLPVEKITAIGGISQKSPFVMQTLADVLGRSIRVARTEQACALGSAMFASVAAGIFSCVEEAQRKLGRGLAAEYRPHPARHAFYDRMYGRYRRLGGFVERAAGSGADLF